MIKKKKKIREMTLQNEAQEFLRELQSKKEQEKKAFKSKIKSVK